MTADPTPPADAPPPGVPSPAGAAQPTTAWAADPQPLPPPAPVIAPPSGGFGGGRVPGALVLVLAPVLAIVMFAGGAFAGRSGLMGMDQLPAPTAAAEAATGTELIDEAWKVIGDNYVDPDGLDDEELAHGAIRGLADAVGDDGHTGFMTAEEAKASDQSLSGSMVGIGVQVSEAEDGGIQVTTVFPGTPAEEAGLKRGDRILAVDGRSTEGESVDETVSRVRGPSGEQVTLTLGREGTSDFDVTITRREFDLPLVTWAMVPGTDIAMVRLEQFATGATDDLKAAIGAAKEAGATGLVFDLRSNPGGYVNEAVGVASQFLADGIVYQAFDRSGERKDAQVKDGGVATELPVVVLADGQTASSAEIVSGAIQDAGRGKVVGEKTFGTGTVLGRFELSDGSVLRIGVERWVTRGGREIWREGLEPDVAVELADDAQPVLPDTLRDMTAAEFAASDDLQVRRAVELLQDGR